MCKDPYFNAQVCRLLVIINVIMSLANVFMFLTIPDASVSILHATFNILIAAWMYWAYKGYRKTLNDTSRKTR